jgi:hypothetical protein
MWIHILAFAIDDFLGKVSGIDATGEEQRGVIVKIFSLLNCDGLSIDITVVEAQQDLSVSAS